MANRKLKPEQIPEIRAKAQQATYKAIAREYGVSPKTIRNVSLGYRWAGISSDAARPACGGGNQSATACSKPR